MLKSLGSSSNSEFKRIKVLKLYRYDNESIYSIPTLPNLLDNLNPDNAFNCSNMFDMKMSVLSTPKSASYNFNSFLFFLITFLYTFSGCRALTLRLNSYEIFIDSEHDYEILLPFIRQLAKGQKNFTIKGGMAWQELSVRISLALTPLRGAKSFLTKPSLNLRLPVANNLH
ncbi:hypothetical protein PRIPAC_70326 [Pristionchus pacificus]|uniref:Uncharacterized protein n=1 Tax=Pristionchus pacificus TaxID=54126 RepID=A0A2A6CFC9_PRIPA|nr:hypothetical protein PRIPAC_70326 [Pristionchus pacificus]|eukprot:PDM76914.1 hypothetical protein PRIPAC_42309 [Pristionchus pacificus]